MAEILLKTEIPRESGFLYFVGTSKDGKLLLCKTAMARGRSKSKVKKKKK